MALPYDAPLALIRQAFAQAVRSNGLDRVAGCADLIDEVADPVLENAARFAREVLSPLNQPGDRQPARCEEGRVLTTPGFAAAYSRFCADGWPALSAPAAFGGLALPGVLGTAVGEMWAGANLAFAMCPEVARGAILALGRHAPASLQDQYLPPLVRGEWTASMAMTESQAGSDLSVVRTRAEADGDTWRLAGQKIYISWGDHDMAENIVHLVLARTPDAPEGVRGLSLFLVPKRWPTSDGKLVDNDTRAVSIEHKMGIRASPTCAMVYGEQRGARAWLVGELHGGLACMFTMMNHMRLGVGMHSLGAADRAVQLAHQHALERKQGRTARGPHQPIIEHADVRRMLLTMHVLTHAARCLVYSTAALLDVAERCEDEALRRMAESRASLLTPVVKAWVSDIAVEVSSLGVQIHGGSGYIDDSEISQIYRDARIGPIFEGTNYIQAQDLLGRKIVRENGGALLPLLDQIQRDIAPLAAEPRLAVLHSRMKDGITRLGAAAAEIGQRAGTDTELIGSVAHHFLQWFGTLLGGWQWALAARDALTQPASDAQRQMIVDRAAFYAAHILPRAQLHETLVAQGSAPISAL